MVEEEVPVVGVRGHPALQQVAQLHLPERVLDEAAPGQRRLIGAGGRAGGRGDGHSAQWLSEDCGAGFEGWRLRWTRNGRRARGG